MVCRRISDDISFSILSKLPLKSLVRFRSVRKSWYFLFENSYFMNMYRIYFASNNNYSYVDDSLLSIEGVEPYYEGHWALFLLSGERFENKIKLDWPPPIQEDDTEFSILMSIIDGTICFVKDTGGPTTVLWNINTQSFKVLPPSPLESPPPSYHSAWVTSHGFGYDHIRNDYKVVRHIAHRKNLIDRVGNWPLHDSVWEVYSLRSNYWKKLDVDMPTGYFGSRNISFRTNEVCHWLDEHGHCLVSFDSSNDVFFRTPLPLDDYDDIDSVLVDRRPVGLNGFASFISSYETKNANKMIIFHISILGEYGVKESWTKLFVVGPLSWVDHPVGGGNKGEIFFKSKDDELVGFDLGTQMIKKHCIKDVIDFDRILYKEVRIPIGGYRNV